MGVLKKVALTAIRDNPVALRAVNREDEKYLGLIDSIKEKGFFGAITVRKRKDEDTKQEYYELVDGLHRFSAAKDAQLAEINVDIVEYNDDQVLEAQIMANVHKVETKPIDYSRQLLKILTRNALMTEAELAGKLGKSPQWISERLGLTKVANETIQGLINEGKINLSNAYALAKLPAEEQTDFVDRAMTMPPDQFLPQAQARVKEIKEAKRQGREASEAEFSPNAYMQKLGDLKEALENADLAAALCDGLKTAAEGFEMGLKFALHLDPRSLEVQQAKHAERLAKKKAEREERAKKKAAATADKAAKAAVAAEEAQKALGGTAEAPKKA